MRRVFLTAAAAAFALLFALPVKAQVTAFEGARIITGDRAADVRVPAGATRVNLAGKTIMPAIVDTHTHLSQTREALLSDLKRRAYFGVGAAMSLGQDQGDLPFQVR